MTIPPTPDDDLRAAVRAVASARSSPCPGEERIFAFYAGSLAPADEDALREHLATCPRCVELGRDARRFLAAMGETEPGGTRQPPAAAVSTRRGWRLPLALAASLTLLAGGLWSGRLLWAPGRSEQPSTGAAHSPPPHSPAEHNPWRDLPVEKAAYAPSTADDLVWRDAGEEAPTPGPFERAMEPYARDELAEAERRLGAYLAQRPGDDRARFYRGVSLLLLGRNREAMPLLEAATRAGGRLRDEARWYLALACLRAGDTARALAELDVLERTSAGRRADARRLLERVRVGGGT